MSVTLVSERYAQGLNAAIEDPSQLEAVLQGLREFIAAYEDSGYLKSAIENPAYPPAQRRAVLEGVLESSAMPGLAAGFVRTLFRRRRMNVIRPATEAFAALVDERLNRITARVISAAALTGDQRERIRVSLERYTGKTVQLETEVDSEILGGVVARLDGIVIDGSLKSRLAQLKQHLLSKES